MAAATFSGARNSVKRKLLFFLLDELAGDDEIEFYFIQNNGNTTRKKKRAVLTLLANNDLEEQKLNPIRITDYVEIIVPHYTAKDFKSHFRMSRYAVEQLILLFGPALLALKESISIAIEKRILVCLWLLATPDSFRSVGDRFDLSKGNVHYIFLEFIKILTDKRHDYILWPNDHSMELTKQHCETKYGFPGAVGAVDGCHIDIKEPVHDKNSYYNRKKRTSVLLQGICNEDLYFTDICVGWPGSVHDARVWKNSVVYKEINQGTKTTCGGHVLGDSAYPLDTFLMVPYKDNGHLSARQKN